MKYICPKIKIHENNNTAAIFITLLIAYPVIAPNRNPPPVKQR